jgi:hypothetical protein
MRRYFTVSNIAGKGNPESICRRSRAGAAGHAVVESWWMCANMRLSRVAIW